MLFMQKLFILLYAHVYQVFVQKLSNTISSYFIRLLKNDVVLQYSISQIHFAFP